MSNGSILSSSKVITIHSFQSKQPLSLYNPHRGLINSATFNHTNKVIASCGQDGKIILVSSQKPDNVLAQFTFDSSKNIHNISQPSINCCLFSPHSKFIAAGSVDSLIKIWEMKNHRDVYYTFKNHTGSITSLSWGKGQDALASSSTSGDIFIHSLRNGNVLEQLTLKAQEGVNCVKISQGDTYSRLTACTNAGTIMVWDLDANKRGTPLCSFENQMKVSVTSLSFSTFHPVLLVAASIDQNLTFYDILEKKAVKTIATQQPLTAVNFYSDGHTLVAGGMYGGLFVYDLRKPQKPRQKLLGHQTAIKYIDFHKQRQANIPQSNSKQINGIKQKLKTTTTTFSKPTNRDSNQQNHLKRDQQKIIKVSSVQKDININQLHSQSYLPISKRQQLSSVIPNPNYQPKLVSNHDTVQKINQKSSQSYESLKNSLQQSISAKFELLHLQIIRQFQIQQQQLKLLIQKSNESMKKKDEYIKYLEQENNKLKKNRY